MMNGRYTPSVRRFHRHCPFIGKLQTGKPAHTLNIETAIAVRDIIDRHPEAKEQYNEKLKRLFPMKDVLRTYTTGIRLSEAATREYAWKVREVSKEIVQKYKDSIEPAPITLSPFEQLPAVILLNIGLMLSARDYGSLSTASPQIHTAVHKPCDLPSLDLSKVCQSVICCIRAEHFHNLEELACFFGFWDDCYAMLIDKFWEKMKRLKIIYNADVARYSTNGMMKMMKRWGNIKKPVLTHLYVEANALSHISWEAFYIMWETFSSLESIRFGGIPEVPPINNPFGDWNAKMPKFKKVTEFEAQVFPAWNVWNAFEWLNLVHTTLKSLYITTSNRPHGSLGLHGPQYRIPQFPVLETLRWTGQYDESEADTLILLGILAKAPNLQNVIIEVSASWTADFISDVMMNLITRQKMKKLTLCTSFDKKNTQLSDGIIKTFEEVGEQSIKPKLTFVVDCFDFHEIYEEKTALKIKKIIKAMESQNCLLENYVDFEYKNTVLSSSFAEMEKRAYQQEETNEEKNDDCEEDIDLNMSETPREEEIQQKEDKTCGKKRKWCEEDDEQEDGPTQKKRKVDNNTNQIIEKNDDEEYQVEFENSGIWKIVNSAGFDNVSHQLRSDTENKDGWCCGRDKNWAIKHCTQCKDECSYATIRYGAGSGNNK